MDNGISESIDYKLFEFVKTLGKGTHGTVILAQQKNSKKKYAIKSIKKQSFDNEKQLSLIKREVEIMASLSHPHIITVHDVCESGSRVTMTLEYACGGELFDYVNESPGGLEEMESKRIFGQISSAVNYLHKKGIVHRDLKLENILLDFNKDAKIADFGLANSFSRDKLLFTYCGSPLYASPEIVKAEPYFGPEVDCWSLGVILYAMSFGVLPFDGADVQRLKWAIVNGRYKLPKDASPALKNLIARMLEPTTEHRMIMKEVVCHAWLNEPSWPRGDYDQSETRRSTDAFAGCGSSNQSADACLQSKCDFELLDGNSNLPLQWTCDQPRVFYPDQCIGGHHSGASNKKAKHHHDFHPPLAPSFISNGTKRETLNGWIDPSFAFLPGVVDPSPPTNRRDYEEEDEEEEESAAASRPTICEVERPKHVSVGDDTTIVCDFRTSSSDRLHSVSSGTSPDVASAAVARSKSESSCFTARRTEATSCFMFSSCCEEAGLFREGSIFEDSLNFPAEDPQASGWREGPAFDPGRFGFEFYDGDMSGKFLPRQLDSLEGNEIRIVQLQDNDDNFSVDSLD